MTTCASTAAATGLPQIPPSLIDPLPRRGFLRGLAKLPLIGGGVKLLGQPTGVAEPVTRMLLAQYWNWLFYERRLLCHEMSGGDGESYRWLQQTYGGNPYGGDGRDDEIVLLSSIGSGKPDDRCWPDFHFPRFGNWMDVPKPSTRAALVMSAVDFDWRGQEDGR